MNQFNFIHSVLRFSSRPLRIVPKVPMTMGITLISTFQSLVSYYYFLGSREIWKQKNEKLKM